MVVGLVALGLSALGLQPGCSNPRATWRPVHVDASLLVVDKGSGLLAVPGVGPGKADCRIARGREAGYPEVTHAAHRLDRDTSGLVALGRDLDVPRRLQEGVVRRKGGHTLVESTVVGLVSLGHAEGGGA